jgi:maltose alpha-D-glucosyltransferase/alpha-amylase
MDAAPFVLEQVTPGVDPGPLDFSILDDWRENVQWHTGDAVLLCEANVSPQDLPAYCAAVTGGPNDRAHMLFAFSLNAALWLALARCDAEPVVQALSAMPRLPAMGQWATFLRNHDELDLSRLTEQQRHDVMTTFAPRPEARIYDRGIRRRLASMMNGERRRIELAYSLQFTMPGTPVLRYGEEIGMGENLKLAGRDAIRTPMQWDSSETAGFSTAAPEFLVRGGPTRGPFAPKHVNVQAQRRDKTSLLRWFEELIRVLRECPEIGVGNHTVLDLASARSVLAHRFDAPEGSILLLHNLADSPITVALAQVEIAPGASEMFSDDDYGALADGVADLHLNGWGYRWIRLRRGR